MLFLLLLLPLFQSDPPKKAFAEFEITTQYELKKKPEVENTTIVLDGPERTKSDSGSDMLPFLTLTLKVKKWAFDVSQVRIVDNTNKTHLKKKWSEAGVYLWSPGFVDDIKDKVSPGKFTVEFLRDKKPVEIIVIQIEEDGTFLINGEKRGKF